MKVLFFDIETSPNIGYTWGKWEQNVIQFKEESKLLTIAYKWAGEKDTFCVTAQGGKEKQMLEAFHKVLVEADVVVGHNGDSFDVKKTQTRMLFHKLPTVKKLMTVDTKKIAKKHFAFNSNSLDDLAKYFGLGSKVKHRGFPMWLDCMADKAVGWKDMAYYNRHDVVLLEELYNIMLDYIKRDHVAFKPKKVKKLKKTAGVKEVNIFKGAL